MAWVFVRTTLRAGDICAAAAVAGMLVVGRFAAGPATTFRATTARFLAGAGLAFGGFMLTLFVFATLVWNGGACAPL